ncbi:MAG TPA: hypothetical protein VJ743_06360 [Albitalea sp.]|nr:hypothetical protein [Albitalea sp.]
MRILVEKSRRPRRWAGVAVFAALVLAGLYAERRDVATDDTAVIANGSGSFQDRLEPPGATRADNVGEATPAEPAASAADQSAQWTAVAPSNSVSTPGAKPTR